MSKKRLSLLFIVLALLIGMAATAIVLLRKNTPQAVTYKKSTPTKTFDSTVVPPSPTKHKLACMLLDDKLALKILGSSAVKNNQLLASGTGDYSSTSCEYTLGSKKASLTLYKYRTAQKAQAGKATVESQQMVFDPVSHQVTTQSKYSVGVVKGVYVVTATVTSGGAYDQAASKQLAQEAAAKL